MSTEAEVWVLLGHRTGDNNQLLRLAGELGLAFRTIALGYNALYRIPPALLGGTLATLDPKSRSELKPPWPKLVLGIGNRSVPAARWIGEQSKGSAKLVRLGNPRVDPKHFDLVLTTPQYAVPPGPNVIRLPVGISTAPRLDPNPEEKAWLARLKRPRRLLLIGGDTFMWTLSPSRVARAAAALREKPGGSVIAVGSGRSSRAVLDSVAEALKGSEHGLVRDRFPRYAVLLDEADEIHVTADSVAMVSDAVATGKPVGLVLPEKTVAGRAFYGLARAGVPVPVRDVRSFWTSMQAQGLAGTLEQPRSGELDRDPVDIAVAAIRRLLD